MHTAELFDQFAAEWHEAAIEYAAAAKRAADRAAGQPRTFIGDEWERVAQRYREWARQAEQNAVRCEGRAAYYRVSQSTTDHEGSTHEC
jgi:hypothetical protein